MDSISGGSIPTDGVVKLTIDSDKVGYIVYPDGSFDETTAGAIDTVWDGDAGKINYYVPNTTNININTSGIAGNIIYSGFADLDCIGCVNLTSVTAVNTNLITCGGSTNLISITAPLAITVNFAGCVAVNNLEFPLASSVVANGSVLLENILAPKSVVFLAENCALTKESIGDILYSAYVDDRLLVNFNFMGGTNAILSVFDAYLIATYGVSFATIEARLVTTNGGVISKNV